MERVWITNGSTSIAPVVNPLAAACHQAEPPTDIYILDNPGIEAVTDRATTLMKTIVTAYDGPEPTITIEQIDTETDFQAIAAFLQDTIDTARQADAEVAIDITPGRRYWSVISFQAGMNHDVDHLYYAHLASQDLYGQCFPTIPRTALDLIDFTEVI